MVATRSDERPKVTLNNDRLWLPLRRRLARHRFVFLLVWPYRAILGAALIVRYSRLVLHWLFRSREHTNFTYFITERNLRQFAWFAASLTDVDVVDVERFQRELFDDVSLRDSIARHALKMRRGALVDAEARYGRRVVWYTLIRICQPEVVVETGVDKGLGTAVIASALARNAAEGFPGRCIAIDINPEAGQLVGAEANALVEFCFEDSLTVLDRIESIDLFIHDSNHDYAHEWAGLERAFGCLSKSGFLLSDAASDSDALDDFSRENRLCYRYAAEQPANHWMRPQGVGVAFRSKARG